MTSVITEQIHEAENDPASPEFLVAQTSSSTYTSILGPSIRQKSLLTSFKQFGHLIYPHWRERKIERGGKPIFPVIKFEDNSEKDDTDPYVAFRRREVRQVRKTRRTDQQSSERLRKLVDEMEQAKALMELVVKRERLRKEALQAEWEVFEQRCKVKTIKRALGIKGEDEDLVGHKKRKVEEKKPLAADAAANSTPTSESAAGHLRHSHQMAAAGIGAIASIGSGTSHSIPANVRLPASKIPDMDLLTLEQVYHDKEMAIRNAVRSKLKARAQADREWINYTDNPFVPYADYFDPAPERMTADNDHVIDQQHSAYSSIVSPYAPSTRTGLKLPLATSLGSSYSSRVEVSPLVLHSMLRSDGNLDMLRKTTEKDMTASGIQLSVPRRSTVSLRRRFGRGGARILVDRRGLVRKPADLDEGSPAVQRLVDRFRFDSENHIDNMEFSCSDPGRLNGISDDTQAIRFGSMLLSKAYDTYRDAYLHRQQQAMSLQQKIQHQQVATQKTTQAASGQFQPDPQQLQQQQQQQQQQLGSANSTGRVQRSLAVNGAGASSTSGSGANGTPPPARSQPSVGRPLAGSSATTLSQEPRTPSQLKRPTGPGAGVGNGGPLQNSRLATTQKVEANV
jgi:enhancer of polycomb-like protein